jgi:hypothetical protein
MLRWTTPEDDELAELVWLERRPRWYQAGDAGAGGFDAAGQGVEPEPAEREAETAR